MEYIVHNPNTLADLKRAVDLGADGIEPDICFHPEDDHFYVHERWPLGPFSTIGVDTTLTVERYLEDVCAALSPGVDRTLRTIIFDIKNPQSFDINLFQSVVRDCLGSLFTTLRIVYSCARLSDIDFLFALRKAHANEVLAVDGGCSPQELLSRWSALPAPRCALGYASGSSLASVSGRDWASRIGRFLFPSLFPPTAEFVAEALRSRDSDPGFRYVYAWTVRTVLEATMMEHMGLDAIICECDLLSLVKSACLQT